MAWSPAPTTGTPDTVSLPGPRLRGLASVEESLARRRSVREFQERELSWDDIGQLLWACQGVTDPQGFRTAPSAGALYPLDVFVVTPSGVYRYHPGPHEVRRIADRDVRSRLRMAALDQDALAAPCIIAIAGVEQRTARKYGNRARRYVVLEAGHAAQNVLLQATTLGLDAVPIGAFDDEEVRMTLGAPSGEEILLLIPVGHPVAE
ncbi:MAG TPA: SagB/ThcOx family dehydrogenase [Vicinamibacterales bacterium]|nr:SagB/ThcOx family dehydrogenase [Vicinamibacterales bacterium]